MVGVIRVGDDGVEGLPLGSSAADVLRRLRLGVAALGVVVVGARVPGPTNGRVDGGVGVAGGATF